MKNLVDSIIHNKVDDIMEILNDSSEEPLILYHNIISLVAQHCEPDMFDLFLHHQIMDADIKCKWKMCELFQIICISIFNEKSKIIIKILLDDSRLNIFDLIQTKNGISPLDACITKGRIDLIDVMINHPRWKDKIKEQYQFNDLHIAIIQSDHNSIKRIIEDNPDLLNNTSINGFTPLHLVNFLNIDDIDLKNTIKMMINHPHCDINYIDSNNNAFLHRICEAEINEDIRYELIESLMEHPNIGPSLNNYCFYSGYTSFHWICYWQNLKAVRLMLTDKRINPGLNHPNGTALHSVCSNNKISDDGYEIIKLLLEDDRIDPNYHSHRVYPVIVDICCKKHVKILNLFLNCNKINNFDEFDKYLGGYMIINTEIFKMLSNSSKIEFKSLGNLIYSSTCAGDLELLRLLIDDPRTTIDDLYSMPLNKLGMNLYEVINLLLNKNINLSIKYGNNIPLLNKIYAQDNHSYNVDEILMNVTKLILRDPELDFTTACIRFTDSPLHQICRHGLYDIFMYLLEIGKITINQLNITNSSGSTLLHEACSCSRSIESTSKLIKFLVKHIEFTSNKHGDNPFHLIAHSQIGKEICEVLLDCGDQYKYLINQRDSSNKTLLHLLCYALSAEFMDAIVHYNIKFIKYLLALENPKIDVSVSIIEFVIKQFLRLNDSFYEEQLLKLIDEMCSKLSYDELKNIKFEKKQKKLNEIINARLNEKI